MIGLSIKNFLPKTLWLSSSNWQKRMDKIRRKDIITLEEAAFYLGFEPRVIAEEARAGHLPAGEIAGQWRFNRWALIEYFALSHTHETQNAAVFCDLEVVAQFLRDVAKGEKGFDSINLSGANLSRKDLSKVILGKANLSYADLSEADLQEAELQHTSLFKADLRGANLTYAELEGADLGEANLSNATLIVDISGAKFHDVLF
jgi:hypothetical protein